MQACVSPRRDPDSSVERMWIIFSFKPRSGSAHPSLKHRSSPVCSIRTCHLEGLCTLNHTFISSHQKYSTTCYLIGRLWTRDLKRRNATIRRRKSKAAVPSCLLVSAIGIVEILEPFARCLRVGASLWYAIHAAAP